MTMTRSRVLLATAVAALAVFAVVQDRVTAAGARRYAALQSGAVPGRAADVTVESVMAPAIRRSVWWGACGAGAVIVLGVAVASRLR